MPKENRGFLISKALSTLLRHQAGNAGIKLDAEGFARLDQVLKWPRLANLAPSITEIQNEVAGNAKQRFSMKPNPDPKAQALGQDDPAHWLIRANQGHSIALASEGLHTPITFDNVPPVVVHGTYFAFWPSIVKAGGLKRMGRTHVHFGTGVPGDDTTEATSSSNTQVHDVSDEIADGGKQPKVISGMRADAELLIFVDVERALRDANVLIPSPSTEHKDEAKTTGIRWWMSENNVVLTEGDDEGVVPLKYFKEVRGRRQGVGVLWRDGEKVADLPEGIVARVPQGKGRPRGGGRSGRGGKGRGGERGRGRGR
ncbi:RNA 2'-phosphotransferase, Tpt1 [Xylaria bambusicola]|uniref:RNA 2'-phosphotransferase, Tpt1 n=1 Tax=Xylaria bambusicola TaxID=326684 RepID=UPI00200751EA|nr:RNA 2'-phosphotransferase, Tpt1 [Xylaria bambusicola]KAI0527789.1 RNA 2'-phosphotransferase, Tpt1 [Xylaria bambusicola]